MFTVLTSLATFRGHGIQSSPFLHSKAASLPPSLPLSSSLHSLSLRLSPPLSPLSSSLSPLSPYLFLSPSTSLSLIFLPPLSPPLSLPSPLLSPYIFLSPSTSLFLSSLSPDSLSSPLSSSSLFPLSEAPSSGQRSGTAGLSQTLVCHGDTTVLYLPQHSRSGFTDVEGGDQGRTCIKKSHKEKVVCAWVDVLYIAPALAELW